MPSFMVLEHGSSVAKTRSVSIWFGERHQIDARSPHCVRGFGRHSDDAASRRKLDRVCLAAFANRALQVTHREGALL